ncbi:MAG: FmdB family zinc ribbon protein [Steroidobacteraceae bacterium]|jgi:putative FmdB family regulatory protein
MPFYEYQCSNCGHSLEAMQKVSDPPLKKCPDCGKSQLQKLMSAPVFRLKGGGWYETDFKSDQDNKRNLADRPEADAPKEEKKETADAAPKEGAAESSKADKAADKPAEKTAADAQKKPAAGAPAAGSAPVRSAAVNKSHPRRSAKRPARAKRSAAKPARRR